MPLTELFPWVAGGLFVVYLAVSAFAAPRRWKGAWLFPALLCVAFLVFSVVAVAAEGPTGFWPVHTQTLWGNQVWFDLLLAGGVGWSVLLPQARVVRMQPLPWLLLVVLTGSVGLLAMIARLNYLQEQNRGSLSK